jgi:hypothetical protein
MREPWLVPGAEAVAALRAAGQLKAAEWWEKHGFAEGFQVLGFRGDSCVPVEASRP